MNQLIKSIQGQTITSLNISEWTGKRHDNIIRDVKNEIQELGEVGLLIFEESSYINSQGKKQPCYTMGKKGAMQLALKYDAVSRYKVIEKLEEIEQSNQIPKSYSAALLEAGRLALALEQSEEDRRLAEAKIEEQKPKVLFADSVSNSNDTILIGQMAKILKQNGIDIGQNRLFEWLRKNGYLIKKKGMGYNSPTQKAMNLGLFKVKETSIVHSSGKSTIEITVKIISAGQIYFVNKFLGKVEV